MTYATCVFVGYAYGWIGGVNALLLERYIFPGRKGLCSALSVVWPAVLVWSYFKSRKESK